MIILYRAAYWEPFALPVVVADWTAGPANSQTIPGLTGGPRHRPRPTPVVR